jgi:exodeoxyribonuclease VII large subunit
MRQAGLGPLYERFLRLKDKLEREGLFDPSAKRPLPEFPRAIGVLTSLKAAALRDVLTTISRRNRSIPVIVYPVPVQGDGAGERIAAMLARANARAECDVLLLVRGGGSIEDLWPFNDEALARALRASRIPVVTGVGHETDFTIADFAADRRAPTPTAAAELATPARAELAARVAECARCLQRDTRRQLEYAMQALDALARRLVHPAERLRASRQHLMHLGSRLALALVHRVRFFEGRLEKLEIALGGLNPAAVLARGYSITLDAKGKVLVDASRVAQGDRLTTRLAQGTLESEVRRKA